MMHTRVIEAGDLHAELWGELVFLERRVDGMEDVTIAEHPALGLCIISHYGYGNTIEWHTQRPITAPELTCRP